MMDATELLHWARGPLLQIGLAVFCFGVLLRLFEIFGLGRGTDLAPPRRSGRNQAWKTIVQRSLPSPMVARQTMLTVIASYLFHLAFLIVLLFFAAHVEFFHQLFGLKWPSLPSGPLDAAALAGIVAMLALLAHRMWHPVKRLLSRFDDYLAWTITALPLLTGYLAVHHLLLPYTLMLAVHIASIALLLALLPFTKLTHTFTVFISRWYNGDILGRKGGGV
jgi:nitrate reductase gamma subunit